MLLIEYRFQWANLQIKQLLTLLTIEDILDRLGKLPRDLKEAYDGIYLTKEKQAKALVDRACMWVMCACTPLTTVELISAISIDPDVDKESSAIDEDLLGDLCDNLLFIDPERKVWRFTHLSVMEYFEDNHWGLRQAHCHAAKVCLKLLIKTYGDQWSESKVQRLSDQEPEDIFDLAHPFQNYLWHHWVIHVRSYDKQVGDPAEADVMLAGLLKNFLGSPKESSVQYRRWHSRFDSLNKVQPWSSWLYMARHSEICPADVPTYVMCRFSFYILLRDWWKCADIDVSHVNAAGDNLLVLAAVAGCVQICKRLIERGMLVNTPLHSGNPLAAAAEGGSIEIVKFLVQEGKADVNMVLQCGDYGSALAAAAEGGSIEIVKFLVQEGKADVNMIIKCGNFGSPLAAAAYCGHKVCVEVLIEAGAETNCQLENGRFRTCLQASQANFSREDRCRTWWDQRTEKCVKLEKAEVAELLVRHGATNEE